MLFFHAGGALPGGYLGVDLFFVLSGYLITSLLLGEHRATGRIALWPFWTRRARRLFPALLLLMPAIAVYARYVAQPAELQGLRADALSTLGYVANWYAIYAHKSYWQLFAAPSPLEHTWSLSIEEQFYVVWPLLVAVVLRGRSSRALLVISLVLTGLSMAAMVALFDPGATSRVYLGTDTRAASILAGAILATVVSPGREFQARTVRWLDGLGIASAIGLSVAWWRLEGTNRFLYHGGFWLTEVAVLALILCAVSGSRSVVARALSAPPLARLGTISYGVYLWHWPVNVFLTPERTHAHGFWLHVMQFTVTGAIAIASYRLVEHPIRLRGIPFGRPVYMVPAIAALAVVLVVRGTLARGLPSGPSVASGLEPRHGSDRVAFRVLLLGDSTANSLGWGLRGVHQPELAVDLLGENGCTILRDMCGAAQWAERTRELRPDATVVFLGGAFMHGLTIDGAWRKSCHPGWDRRFEANLARRLGDLRSPGGRVFTVTVPYPLGIYDNATFRAEVDCINTSIRRSSASVPGVEILDLAQWLCPAGVCRREFAGQAIRPDGVHYTIEGAAGLSRWVLGELHRPTVHPPAITAFGTGATLSSRQ